MRETFRWHSEATVTAETYQALRRPSPDRRRGLFRRPAHQPPDPAHAGHRRAAGRHAGPRHPSQGSGRRPATPQAPHPAAPDQLQGAGGTGPLPGADTAGTHTARFGEVEQRGIALTRKGRQRYDALLARAREQAPGQRYEDRLTEVFTEFPDDLDTLRAEGLAFFRYALTDDGLRHADPSAADLDIDALLARGLVQANPITYEDFLPVSAAGIFRSNLGSAEQRNYSANARAAFERDLGCAVHDEIALYEAAQAESLARVRAPLGQAEDAALPA